MSRKILVTSNSLGIGGIEKAMLALVNTLPPEEYDIDLLLMSPRGEYLKMLHPNIKLLSTPKQFEWIGLPKNAVIGCVLQLLCHPIWLFYFLRNIVFGLRHGMAQGRQRMWRDCIDAVPTLDDHYDIALDFSGLLRRYVLEKVNADKKYTWIHSDYRVYGLDREIDHVLLQQFDCINCVSDTCKAIFDEVYPDLAHQSRVELNRIDTEFIMSQVNGKGFDDDFDGIRLLDVTRIDPYKGLDIAVKVCRELKDRGKKFRWYVLGNDPLGYQATLEKLIKEYNVENTFILAGFTSNPYPYMYQADIIVHFSYFEGRSVSIDEALVLKKTILLTNYPTAKDQIKNGVNGFICDFDVQKLADAIENMMRK